MIISAATLLANKRSFTINEDQRTGDLRLSYTINAGSGVCGAGTPPLCREHEVVFIRVQHGKFLANAGEESLTDANKAAAVRGRQV